MAAKEIMFFFPSEFEKEIVITNLVDKLALEVINIPAELGLTFEFSAKRGEGTSYLSIEYVSDAKHIIQELSNWENPSKKYKNLILACRSCMTVYYRDINEAKHLILVLSSSLNFAGSQCVVENGNGCLLLFSDIFFCLQKDEKWSWERYEFPEFPDVALSEWTTP